MDEKRLYDVLDGIREDIGNIKIVQVVHTEQLSEHMRRTALLETALEKHEDSLREHEADDIEALNKIDKKLAEMSGIKTTLWLVGSILGILVALSKIL